MALVSSFGRPVVTTAGGIATAQDARAATAAQFNQKMAQEQWNWQKKLYGQQQVAAGQIGQGLSGLIGQFNQAYGEAKSANEQRYQEMLGITDTTTGQRAADIRGDYAGQQSNMMQRLASLGMANTTIAPTMGMGIRREEQAALDRSADTLQGTRLGIMERRTDEYPKSDIIMQLVQALGQGGGPSAAGGIAQALSNMRIG